MNYNKRVVATIIVVTAILLADRANSSAATFESGQNDNQAPQTPADFAAQVLNDTTVKLTWSASTDNVGVVGYQLFESGSAISYVGGTVFRHEHLTPQSTYRYQVAAIDAAGNLSAATAIVEVDTGDNHRPAVPRDLTADVINDQTIQLNWQAAVDNVATVGYKLYDRGLEIADIAKTAFTHQDLPPVTTFRYSVKAYDAAGNLSLQDPQLVVNTGDTTAPTVPASVVAEVLNDSKVSLSWQTSGDNVGLAGYRVYQRFELVAEVSSQSFVHTGLAPNSQLVYTIVAFDNAGNTSPGASPAVVNTGDTTSPSTPMGLTAQALNDRAIRLSWQPSTDNVAVAGYLLFNRGEQIADVIGTTHDHLRLRPATVYRYNVKAYDAKGNISLQEPQIVVDTGDTTAPLPPPDLAANPRGENEVKVLWGMAEDNVGVVGYRLFESGVQIADVAERLFVHTGLKVATEYRYHAIAYDSAGNESAATSLLVYTTPDLTKPDEPQSLQAEVLDDARVLLTWSGAWDNVGVARYEILDTGEKVGEASGTKFVHEGLPPLSIHKYKVRSVDSAGNQSDTQSFVVVNTGDTTPPEAPGGFSSQVLDDTTISLSWQAAQDNVEVQHYQLFESGSFLAELETPGFIHSGLSPVTTYNYTLRAYDAAGNASGVAGVLSPHTGDTTLPTTPGAFTLTFLNETSILLSWLASSDNVAVAGYEVLADEQVVAAPAQTGLVLSNLSPSDSRSYSVRAVDHSGLRSVNTAALTAAPSDNTTVELLDLTFLPLFARLNYSDREQADHQFSPIELQQIATHFKGFWGSSNSMPPQSQIDWLRSVVPGFQALAYLNSSHTPSRLADLQIAEAQRLTMINVYHEGNLVVPISSTDVELRVTPADGERGWGLIPSTIEGDNTADALEYVTYLRIDDELMRIEAVDVSTGTVTVTRGFQSTVARPHSVGSQVLAPVYTGPGGDDGISQSIPGNPAGVLPAYSLQVGTPAAAQYFASQVHQLVESGLDGGWLDICSPRFFNQVNALGATVTPWNLETGAAFSATERKLHHDRKLGRIQQQVSSATGEWPLLVANNLSNGTYFESGGGGMDYLLPTPDKPVAINGVVLEAAFSEALRDTFSNEIRWKENLSTIVHGSQNGLPVWPWIKSATNDYRVNTPNVDRFELYDYASILLGWELDSYAFVSLPLFVQSTDGRSLNLAEWLFYDLGEPVDRVSYDAVEALRVQDTQSFLRQWTKAAVLVNPSSVADPSVPLPGQYLVPATGQMVTSISVPAHTAFLLIAVH